MGNPYYNTADAFDMSPYTLPIRDLVFLLIHNTDAEPAAPDGESQPRWLHSVGRPLASL